MIKILYYPTIVEFEIILLGDYIMKCINCQVENSNPKFCSKSCAASWNNKLKPKRLPEGSCKQCKNKISTKETFCSINCKEKHHAKLHKNKICCRCDKIFPRTLEYFYTRGNGQFVSYCKDCYSVKTVERQRKFKQRHVDYKGGKCVICGYLKCNSSLTFHHLDPSEKEFELGQAKVFNFEKAKKELDKCILVCRNCHGEIHSGLHPQYLIVKDQK